VTGAALIHHPTHSSLHGNHGSKCIKIKTIKPIDIHSIIRLHISPPHPVMSAITTPSRHEAPTLTTFLLLLGGFALGSPIGNHVAKSEMEVHTISIIIHSVPSDRSAVFPLVLGQDTLRLGLVQDIIRPEPVARH